MKHFVVVCCKNVSHFLGNSGGLAEELMGEAEIIHKIGNNFDVGGDFGHFGGFI